MNDKRFEEAYQKYRKLVMKMVHDCLKDTLLAEEISQQVFMSFYEHMDNISQEELVKPWLIIATRNAIVDHVRKQENRRNKTAYLHADAALYAPGAEEEAVERIAVGSLSCRILDDLREKNERWYEVVVAICVEGMSQQRAAEHLQIGPQVLNARLYRARQYIRNKYRDEWNDG